jgi:hypothetical protein
MPRLTAKTKLVDTCVVDQWGKACKVVSGSVHIEDLPYIRNDPAVKATMLRVPDGWGLDSLAKKKQQ